MSFVFAKELPGLQKGDSVFLIITPGTMTSFLRSYRPKPYYVLEAHITDVREKNGEETRYILDSKFLVMPGRATTDVEEARSRLVQIFAKETDGALPIEKVRLVSSDEQKAGEKIVHEKQFIEPPAYTT